MRNKIIMIAAMLAVMVAMTGIAVANPSTTASPGALDVNIIADTPTLITVTHKIQAGDLFADGISFRIIRTNPSVPGVTTELTGSWDGTTYIGGSGDLSSATLIGDTYTWVLYVKDDGNADDGAQIDYTYKASFQVSNTTLGVIGSIDAFIGGSSTNLNPIPEFPTVALPIAAVIGLVFFFQQRKKKEE